MQELDEDLVRVIWLKLSEQSPQEVLAAMQRFRDEQDSLFAWLALSWEGGSEVAQEIVLYLAVTLHQVIAWRRLPKGPLALPEVDAERVERWAKKRGSTVRAYLAGKQARSKDLTTALEALVDRFELRQLPLLGHATEGLLAAHEDGDLSREEVEECFLRLLVHVDVLDQVVKS